MKQNNYWWITPLIINAILASIIFKYWNTDTIFVGTALSDILFVGSALLVVVNIVMGIWWFIKLIPMKTGFYSVITNIGGEYMHTVTGHNDDGFYNNRGSRNFDKRYPIGYYIPTVIHSEKRMWGPPGYNSNIPALPDKLWKDPRNIFEMQFGYHFPGFFTKVQPQLIHTHIVKKRDSVSEEELKSVKFADKTWAVFEETHEYQIFAPIYDEDVIIVSAKTGADGATTDPKLKDELLDINIPIGIQTIASNPFTLATKTTDIHLVLVDRTDTVIRDFVGNRTIGKLQLEDHAPFGSDFVKAMLGMNGKWVLKDGRYFLSPGLDDGFGFRVTEQCSLKEWGPATEMATEMLNSTRRITISFNKIAEETNLGEAEKQKKIKAAEARAKEIELVSTEEALSDERKRKAAVKGGVNPEVQVIWDNVGKLKGNVYFGTGVNPVTSVDAPTGIVNTKSKKEKEGTTDGK